MKVDAASGFVYLEAGDRIRVVSGHLRPVHEAGKVVVLVADSPVLVFFDGPVDLSSPNLEPGEPECPKR